VNALAYYFSKKEDEKKFPESAAVAEATIAPLPLPLSAPALPADITAGSSSSSSSPSPSSSPSSSTTASSTLDEGILRPGIVHRLDKGTSGVIVVAKTPEALAFYANAFKTRSVHKTYLAIGVGLPVPGQSTTGAIYATTHHTQAEGGRTAADTDSKKRGSSSSSSSSGGGDGGGGGEWWEEVVVQEPIGRHPVRSAVETL
jgi:hypothetical protein